MNWDFNRDKLVNYDIMPYIFDCYGREKRKPTTEDETKKFILAWCTYQFWSRCEYEMLVSGWPARKNTEKVDAFQQITMNIDAITALVYQEIQVRLKRKNKKPGNKKNGSDKAREQDS